MKNNNIKILLGESVLDKIKTLSLQKKTLFTILETFYNFLHDCKGFLFFPPFLEASYCSMLIAQPCHLLASFSII